MLAYNLFTKSRALGTMNFYPDKVRQMEFDGATPVIQLGILAQNTSNQNLVVRSFAGNLYSNDFLIGNVSSFVPFQVAPNSQTLLILNVRLSLIGIVNDIIRAWTEKNFTQNIQVRAYANIDNYQVPVNLSFKIGLNGD